MKKVWLDFQRTSPNKNLLGALLLAMSLALSTTQIYAFIKLQEDIEATQESIYKLEHATAEARITTEGESYPQESVVKRLQQFGSKAWEEFFLVFEKSANENVTLLSLQPDGNGLTIIGEAKSTAATAEYLKSLHSTPKLSRAYLSDFEVIDAHPQRPVHFAIVVPGEEEKE